MASNISPEQSADKTVPVSGRVTLRERRLIWIAAAHRGVKPAEFITRAALDAAMSVIASEQGKPLSA
jgi:uncharacterized protein (DUF1778 family)